jgi:hypothetical protein
MNELESYTNEFISAISVHIYLLKVITIIFLFLFLSYFLFYIAYNTPNTVSKFKTINRIYFNFFLTFFILFSVLYSYVSISFNDSSIKFSFFIFTLFFYGSIIILFSYFKPWEIYFNIRKIVADFILWVINIFLFTVSLYTFALILWQLFVNPAETAKFSDYFLLLGSLLTFFFLSVTAYTAIIAVKSFKTSERSQINDEIKKLEVDIKENQLEKVNCYDPIKKTVYNIDHLSNFNLKIKHPPLRPADRLGDFTLYQNQLKTIRDNNKNIPIPDEINTNLDNLEDALKWIPITSMTPQIMGDGIFTFTKPLLEDLSKKIKEVEARIHEDKETVQLLRKKLYN